MSAEPTAVCLELHVDADFVDLFAVKEGRSGPGRAEVTAADGELLLHDRSDRVRGLSVSATVEPDVLPGSLVWRVVVPAGQTWQTEIIAQPTLGNQRVQVPLSPGQHYGVSEPGRKIEAWRDTATDIVAQDPVLTRVLRRTESDLGALQIHDDSGAGRPFVAAGAPWFMTLFGRDSLLTAWMALPLEVGPGGRHIAAAGRNAGPDHEPAHRGGAGPDHARDAPRPIRWAGTRRPHLLRLGRRHPAVRDAACRVPALGRRSGDDQGNCCPPPTRRCGGSPTMATGTATASSNTGAPPTADWSTRAGRTATTASTTRRDMSPRRRSRCARCRATCIPRCWPAPNWPKRSTSHESRARCVTAPQSCAVSSPSSSGCRRRAGTRSPSIPASAGSTR